MLLRESDSWTSDAHLTEIEKPLEQNIIYSTREIYNSAKDTKYESKIGGSDYSDFGVKKSYL